ncbi:homoserine O-acetyltransferase [Fistulifera solaris]|uniref:Homoserine O-acetyltransferase n=1 Tax=Fistulifera solaris TaxID=1519565 RepID=A0A1Z5JGF7_FISSO|nr:homoserine O-acetyltransferase [Fistulifera solaris]|eukprot:GAX12858.1 homoserine O-acetyltransferase [Fistulifera solaris]
MIWLRNAMPIGWRRRYCSLSSSLATTATRTLIISNSCHSSLRSDVEMIAANHRIAAAAGPLSRNTSHSNNLQQRSFAASTAPTTTNNDSEMKDEYGAMDDSGHTFVYQNFVLENGQVLPEAQLRYQTYGTLNATKDNVLVVCHALTGNASLHAWWGDLLGDQLAFDTSQYFVVCCNLLGSCYGSTNPTSLNPRTGRPYGKDFPDVSVRDSVRLQLLLLQQELQLHSVKAVIGGSFGGMQTLEFAVQAGSSANELEEDDAPAYLQDNFYDTEGNPFVRSVIPIACGAQHTAWQIAISEVQRQAIQKDPHWENEPEKATAGLEIARQLGMVTYRTPKGYQTKFGRDLMDSTSPAYGTKARWQVQSYLEYQGQKFLSRFDPITYVKLTEQMDSHDLARGRGDSLEEVLRRVTIPALVLGIDSDVLYPLAEQEELAELLPGGTLKVIHSEDGHDGFLLEQEQVGQHIIDFLQLRE